MENNNGERKMAYVIVGFVSVFVVGFCTTLILEKCGVIETGVFTSVDTEEAKDDSLMPSCSMTEDVTAVDAMTEEVDESLEPKQSPNEEKTKEATQSSPTIEEEPRQVVEQAVTVPPVVAESDDDRIYDVPEQSAEFPGDVYAWLAKNIKYPSISQEQGIQGRVTVQFVINKDGSIVDVKVLRSPDENLAKEAQRVVRSMPHWRPAKNGNKYVRMRYVLPVMFRLN